MLKSFLFSAANCILVDAFCILPGFGDAAVFLGSLSSQLQEGWSTLGQVPVCKGSRVPFRFLALNWAYCSSLFMLNATMFFSCHLKAASCTVFQPIGLPGGWTMGRSGTVKWSEFKQLFPHHDGIDKVWDSNNYYLKGIKTRSQVSVGAQDPLQPKRLRTLSLFSGVAGLELGISKPQTQFSFKNTCKDRDSCIKFFHLSSFDCWIDWSQRSWDVRQRPQ